MYTSLFVLCTLLVAAYANTQIIVRECGTLDVPFASYRLGNNVVVKDHSYGSVCFNIIGDGISLDGYNFELTSSSGSLIPTVGVQYSGNSATVTNMYISNIRTGIRANGKFGKIDNNTITGAVNGIDVSATHNRICNNFIGNFEADESTSGIYIFFSPVSPVDSYTNVTSNVIANIRGDSFALGVSVYFATSVYIVDNHIYDLHGGIKSEAISVIHGSVEAYNNTLTPPEEGGYLGTITALLISGITLLASMFYIRSSPTSSVQVADMTQREEATKEAEKAAQKKMYKDEFDSYGEDVPKRVKKSTMSFSIGSSPAGMMR